MFAGHKSLASTTLYTVITYCYTSSECVINRVKRLCTSMHVIIAEIELLYSIKQDLYTQRLSILVNTE